MKAIVTCPNCKSTSFRMKNVVTTPEVVVYCDDCGKRIGQFSAYGFTEEEKKSDTH